MVFKMSRVAVYRSERELRSYRKKLKREKQIRRNLILGIAGAIMLMLFAVSFYSITSLAQEEQLEVSYKYFTSIQIERGDSLWSIAEEYGDEVHYESYEEYITEVKSINHLKDDEIVAGQYLIIPYYSYEFVK